MASTSPLEGLTPQRVVPGFFVTLSHSSAWVACSGLDTAFVEHVILFDFPRDPSEYVRRVGRTARGPSGEGLVSVLVLGRQVPLAQQIMERNRRGMPIHKVPMTEN